MTGGNDPIGDWLAGFGAKKPEKNGQPRPPVRPNKPPATQQAGKPLNAPAPAAGPPKGVRVWPALWAGLCVIFATLTRRKGKS